ncbi:M13-type metalloendopeptidase [Simiduia curdlanivorans]|uniref:M13 family metallopeptidase n=1 Tax=Simiduia curdlanivorans TaxID=1492769 RepID=A0ABV8V2Q4_9GAMM|nr:M13-type metalloendopeptidase [Simiduia curdlanivorans]MDN3641015.1 M13-type metalloendopeptidase [Simiduia curdlanivorans]
MTVSTFKPLRSVALVACATAALLAGCSSDKEATPEAKKAPALVAGIDLGNMEPSTRAQDDFYRHVNGQWLAKTAIPADKSNYGSFTKLADDAEVQLRAIIESAAASAAKEGTEQQKVGDFFKSYMNTEKLEQLGASPIAASLAEIDALASKDALLTWFGKVARVGVNTPVAVFINQDKRDATQYAVYTYQSGIGLPDRDYYFKEDEKSQAIRAAYKKHILASFALANVAANADSVYAIEEALAQGHWQRVDNRDPVKTYNKMPLAELSNLSAGVNWGNWAQALGIDGQANIIVYQPSYLTVFGDTLATKSLEDWKAYAKWQVISGASTLLSKAFDDEHFTFYSKTLRGVEEQQERWKRAVQFTDDVIGEAVGKIYVEQHFPPEAKARMDQLVNNLLLAFGEGINDLEWMTEETKVAAREKLSKFTYKIGYPDKWRDYASLVIKADDLFGNAMRAAAFEYARNLSKLGAPVDKTEWFMTPQTVNAYYNPVANEIVFPAAILQPPFFNLAADDAVNYGGIGAVIGHEIGHGFDDSGSQYDGDGNLRNWWTDSDRTEFEKRTTALVEQYNAFEPLPGEFVNGKFTLGENIGDLGGLTIAHKAYLLSLQGKSAPVIDELTGEQRFFMGWAQVWARKYRDEELSQRLVTDPHSPSEFRTNGIVRNMPAFYDAFGVKEGDALFLAPEARVKIW